jgi:Ca-activated chloride channel family protein
MNCEEAESLLGQLVFDDLEEDRKEPLRRHVEKCQKCRELAGDMKVAAKLLKDGVELETPVLSADARAKLLVKAGRRRTRARSGLSIIVKVAAVAACVVLVAGLLLPNLATSRLRSMKPQRSLDKYEGAAAPAATAPCEEPADMEVAYDAPDVEYEYLSGTTVVTERRPLQQARNAVAEDAMPEGRARGEIVPMRLVAPSKARELAPTAEPLAEQKADADDFDVRTARAQEDAISDIPLGGLGVVGNIGIGGGAAGADAVDEVVILSHEEKKVRPAGYDGTLTATSSPRSVATPVVVATSVPQAAIALDKIAQEPRRLNVAPDVPRDYYKAESAPTVAAAAAPNTGNYWKWEPGQDDGKAKQKSERAADESLMSQLHALSTEGDEAGGADDADAGESRKAKSRLKELAEESIPAAPSPKPSRSRERGIALSRASASVVAPEEVGMDWAREAEGQRAEVRLAHVREDMDYADKTMQMAESYRRRGDAASAQRLYDLAAEKYASALETYSWVPAQVDLGGEIQKAEASLKRARALSGKAPVAEGPVAAESYDWRTLLERADKAASIAVDGTSTATLLDKKVNFSFRGETIHDALSRLALLTHLKIDIDPDLVERAKSCRVGLVAQDMKLGLGLEWLLRLGDLQYSVHQDGLFVSSPERIARDRLIALNVDEELPVRSARWQAAQEMLGVEPPERIGAPSTTAPARVEQAFVQLSQDEAAQLDQAVILAQQAARARAEHLAEEDEPEPRLVEEEAPLPEVDEDRPPPPVNPFVLTARDRFSTFAMDVDTASYSLARNYITRGSLPARNTVRMEEYVNAFDYNYPRQARDTFNIFLEGTPAPFGQGLQLLKVGIQARVVGRKGRKSAHLTFVVDSSGSMETDDRLPLVQHALKMLLGELSPSDHVSLVAYGTEPQILLEFVAASDRERIEGALDSIRCAGSTNLSTGLTVGYDIAKRQFNAGAINRVILCSDGVANVGLSEAEEILDTVKQYRDWGISITSAGFGSGSYSDEMLEKLANSGDGNYVFIDSPQEARRVFVEQMSATIQNVAKDAKIQVEFDPSAVRRYRLIGYENRDIADKDFRNDSIDAGEVGSGQSVTALYEIEFEPDALRNADVGTVFVRYRNTDTNEIEEISRRIARDAVAPHTPESNPRLFLAASAAEFAELLRGSEHAAGGSFAAVVSVLERATGALPLDQKAKELLSLVKYAKRLKGEK